MKSYIRLFRNYANFSGFLKRGEYWKAVIVHLIILSVPLVPAVLYLVNEKYMLPGFYIPWVLPLWCFYFLLTRIPLLSAAVRRLLLAAAPKSPEADKSTASITTSSRSNRIPPFFPHT